MSIKFFKRLYTSNMSASRLWYYSCKAYQRGWLPVAILLKGINYVLYHALLCYQCEIEKDLHMLHNGFGCVVHPHVTIGHRVRLYQGVLLAAESPPGSSSRIVIEDDVIIGASAIIIGNDHGGIRIGKGAMLGAGTIVNRDVAPGLKIRPTWSHS